MKYLPAAIMITFCLSIGGCTTLSGPSHAEMVTQDQTACSEYGFKAGTDAFAQCMEQRDSQRSAAYANAVRAAAHVTYNPVTIYTPPPPTSINCTTYPVGTFIQTNCR